LEPCEISDVCRAVPVYVCGACKARAVHVVSKELKVRLVDVTISRDFRRMMEVCWVDRGYPDWIMDFHERLEVSAWIK